jgi:single-strand DNA-binding protein
MANLNKIFLLGNLTNDPQFKQTKSGSNVTVFGMAINEKYKKGDGTEGENVCFVDVVAWDRQAELCNEYLKKGKLVFVEGRLNFHSWEDEQGQRWSKLEVYAFSVQFL